MSTQNNAYGIAVKPLSGSEDCVINIKNAGSEESYKDCRVSEWFDYGVVTVPGDNGFDLVLRMENHQSIDTALSQAGFEFADEDRMIVKRSN